MEQVNFIYYIVDFQDCNYHIECIANRGLICVLKKEQYLNSKYNTFFEESLFYVYKPSFSLSLYLKM